jgi:hypothetical protein
MRGVCGRGGDHGKGWWRFTNDIMREDGWMDFDVFFFSLLTNSGGYKMYIQLVIV